MQSQPQYRSSYYAVLGVHPRASAAEIRAAYHRLAMRWHPDKIANGRADPARAEEAKARFQQIHEAYKVLSDEKRRALYDAGMYDPLDDDQEEVEGFHDFLQEMLSLMAAVGREEPVYSLGELQSMLNGMMQDFASPQPTPPPPSSFFANAAPSTRPSGGQQQRRSSSSVRPQGFSSSACFTRTAFSGC